MLEIKIKCSFSWGPSASPLWVRSLPSQASLDMLCVFSVCVWKPWRVSLICLMCFIWMRYKTAVNPASRELFLTVIWKVRFLALVLSLTQTCFYSPPPHPPPISLIYIGISTGKSNLHFFVAYFTCLQNQRVLLGKGDVVDTDKHKKWLYIDGYFRHFKLLWIYFFLIFFLKNFIEV